jgi:hypothetical protein
LGGGLDFALSAFQAELRREMKSV